MVVYSNTVLFDFPNLPREHAYYSPVVKGMPGRLKLKFDSRIITEFAALKKQYALKLSDQSEKIKAKSVPYSNQKNLKFEKFVNVLFDNNKLTAAVVYYATKKDRTSSITNK